MPSLIQLTRRGVVIHPQPGRMEELQRQFAERHFVLLTDLIDPEILNVILDQIRAAQFVERDDAGIAHESWLPDTIAKETLMFMMNSPGFLRFVEEMTGRKPLSMPGGRIYRFAPTEEHHDNWHNDIIPGQDRVLAFSINLSQDLFDGGELVIRDSKSKKVVAEIANTRLGNAVIFRVDPALEHRVSAVRGEFPRTAFAGWFCNDADLDVIRQKLAQFSHINPSGH